MNIANAPDAVDVAEAVDTGRWSRFQKLAAAMAAAAIVLDGFDSQLIAFAIPVLIEEWGVTRSAFAPVVAAGLAGMACGSAAGGLIGDRLGRRRALVASVFMFGTCTALIGFADALWSLALLRFLAGLGIGGALPTATTLAAEFTPSRWRTLVVTAAIVCVPLGGMLAGLFAGEILPGLGWRALFWIGGTVPVLFGIVLVASLPESPRFLVGHPARWPELRRLLHDMGRPVARTAAFHEAAQTPLDRPGWTAPFAGGRLRDSVALWTAFFLCLLSVYTAFSWLPTLLTSEGLDVAAAGAGLTAYNLGGVIGALACAAAITRYGSRWPLAVACLGGALSAAALRGVDPADGTMLALGLAVHGLFVNAVQSTLYAVCAHVYPTRVRASGTAAALTVGRLGAILSAFAGAAVITAGGAGAYFGLLATAMLGVAVALLVVRDHIPGTR